MCRRRGAGAGREPEEVGIRLMEESKWRGTAVFGGIDGGGGARRRARLGFGLWTRGERELR